jgi:hypothetical protein
MGRAIPITDGHGTLLPDAWPRILAVMIWPEDERACSDLHASMVARAFVEHGYRNEILKDPARRYGPRWEKALPRLGQLWTAGELLQLVLNTLLESPREATLYRAIHLYQRDYGGGQLHDGQMVSFSQRYLRGVWNQFKSVAHLTAAWKVMRESGRSAELEVLGLLSNSEALRILGEYHHPAIGRLRAIPGPVSLLDPERTWRPPPDLLPKLPPVTIDIPALTDFAREELKKYQKP